MDKPPLTDADYLDAYKRMFYAGQLRLVVPPSLQERKSFMDMFDNWLDHTAACDERTVDTDSGELIVCAELGGHMGQCWGIEPTTAVDVPSQGVGL